MAAAQSTAISDQTHPPGPSVTMPTVQPVLPDSLAFSLLKNNRANWSARSQISTTHTRQTQNSSPTTPASLSTRPQLGPPGKWVQPCSLVMQHPPSARRACLPFPAPDSGTHMQQANPGRQAGGLLEEMGCIRLLALAQIQSWALQTVGD